MIVCVCEPIYHECLILKLVSEVEVGHKVAALLIWVSPRHGGTDWTHLQCVCVCVHMCVCVCVSISVKEREREGSYN